MKCRNLKLTAPIAAAVIAFAFLSSGCSHSLAPTQSHVYFPTGITDWNNPGFANADNPFDTVGLYHNEALNYAAARRGSWSPDTLYPSCDTLIVHFVDSIEGLPSDSLLWFSRFNVTHIDSIENASDQNSEFGPEAIADIQHMESIYDGGYTLSNAIDSFENVEDDADTSLSANSRTVVLCAGAIARYSYAYWLSPDTAQWTGWNRYAHRAVVDRAGLKGRATPQATQSQVSADLRGAWSAANVYDGSWAVCWEIGAVACIACGAVASAMSN